MADDEKDEDVVIQEFDVYLAKSLASNLFVFQYPVRPRTSTYDDAAVLEVRVKPKQQKVELDIALDTDSPCYDKSRGEHLAINSSVEKINPTFNSKVMDMCKLSSTTTVTNSRYAIGLIRDGELHLTPVKGVLQLRPSFCHMDQCDSKNRSSEGAATEDGYNSPGEEEEAKPITVKFARPETDRARKAREKSFKFMQQKMAEEPWTKVQFHHFGSEATELERVRLQCMAPDVEVPEFNVTSKAYLKMLIPDAADTNVPKPNMSSNVISMAQLRTLPLGDQIRSILIRAKVIKFNQLLSLLPPDVDPLAVPRSLQQVAMLVQGCWVVKSEVLYPKESFSPHSGISADAICKARDYIMWRFTQSSSVTRKEICSLVKLPNEDLKDILEHIARCQPVKGWEFVYSFDDSFVRRYPEVVQRQQMLWDAKHHQLQKLFKLPAIKVEADATAARYQHKRTKSGAESYLDGIDHLAHISIKTESSDFDIKPDVSKIRLTSSNPVYTKATKLEPGNSGLRLNEDAVRTIKQEVIKIKQEPVDIDMNSMEVDNCDTDSFHLNGTNYMSDGVEEATFREELRAFVLEKLRTLHCITIAALKCQLHYKLAESPPGHILSRGITDKLLEQTILDIGGKVVNSSWPTGMKEEPLYAYSDFGDQSDEMRKCLINLFQQNHKYQKAVFKKRFEELMGAVISDVDLTKLLKDYCGPATNGYYSLKFANTLSAQS